ncbi:MAG: PAS domain S-box protein [Nitrospirae bacterium]|nr:PAS domain S-box protein [Nitrospirota bacterium]MCL5978749.1 PAS domain S-box protein [Nitrospirota bacterium]
MILLFAVLCLLTAVIVSAFKVKTTIARYRQIEEERRLAENALRQSEGKYRGIFENIVEGIYHTSMDGRLLSVNPALAGIFGYDSPQEMMDSLINVKYQLYVDPSDRDLLLNMLEARGVVKNFQTRMYRKDGSIIWVSINVRIERDAEGKPKYLEGIMSDITKQKDSEEERERLILELQNALSEVKTLSGMLPICASCKKIRADEGYWQQIETYISEHSGAEFSHSICPECAKKLYPEYYNKIWGEEEK